MGADGSSGLTERPWRAAVTQVFVDDLVSPVLDEPDQHHLSRVLRLGDGELVCAADGRGGWRPCRFRAGGLQPDGEIGHVPRSESLLTVGFAPVKGDRPEWAVQKLTEVDIDRILLLQTDRSVVRWERARADKHVVRLGRIAREASQQCRRLWIPEVDLVAMSELGSDTTLAEACLADAGGRPLQTSDRTVLVGPEGGWTNGERDGRTTVALGAHVLRSETAAVVAASAMASLRLGLSRPGLPSLPP